MFKSKYRAKPTHGFPSRLEYAVFQYLKRRETCGEIENINRQSAVLLKNCEACGDRVVWKVDFSFTLKATAEIIYAEAKGAETASYKKRLKLWRKNPPATLEIYKGSHSNIKLVERIEKAAA